MNDLSKFIHGNEHDPYKGIRVNPIEKDKKAKEDAYTPPDSLASKIIVLAALAFYFKKIFTPFFSEEKGSASFFDADLLFKKIASFKKMLQILCHEDLSHDPDYTQQLTEIWNAISDIYKEAPLSERKDSKILTELELFMQKIQNFPEGQDHTLGYYLNEYAGKNWIPFPFMEILEKLYRDYTNAPGESVLLSWIDSLTEILSTGQNNLYPSTESQP